MIHAAYESGGREEGTIRALTQNESPRASRNAPENRIRRSVHRAHPPRTEWIFGAPAIGRGVRNHAMRRMPPEAEQKSHEGGARVEEPRLVRLVRVAFGRQKESRPDGDSRGARGSRPSRRFSIPDSARGEYGPSTRYGDQLRHDRVERLRRQQMATRRRSLRDEGIGAVRERAAPLVDRADLMHDDRSGRVERLDGVPIESVEQRDHGHALGDTRLDVRAAYDREEQIRRKWTPAGELARACELAAKSFGFDDGADGAEPARRRNRAGKLRPRETASEAGLNDRMLDAKEFTDIGGHRIDRTDVSTPYAFEPRIRSAHVRLGTSPREGAWFRGSRVRLRTARATGRPPWGPTGSR